ncbi:hypothetical protein LguiB_027688 [Lonicera macranthoides]
MADFKLLPLLDLTLYFFENYNVQQKPPSGFISIKHFTDLILILHRSTSQREVKEFKYRSSAAERKEAGLKFIAGSKLNAYCKDPRHKWKATLKHDYFNSPWRTASTSAAIVLLALTFIQTVCSILGAAKDNCHGESFSRLAMVDLPVSTRPLTCGVIFEPNIWIDWVMWSLSV